jgi:hypothetical protein
LHGSHRADPGARYALSGYEALVVSAGTATSTRGRGEANSFNVLRLSLDQIEVERFGWYPAARRFAGIASERFAKRGIGWEKV